jgi:two-component system nitrogen regulation sensor histidine kinase GlnL
MGIALSQSEILDSLVSAILVTDADMLLEYMNQAAQELIGSSFLRIKGQPIHSIISSSQLDHHIKQALSSNQSQVAREGEIVVQGYQCLNVDCAITPLFKDEIFSGMLFELTRVDRQLRIAREAHLINTQATNESVLRGIAHEIKNPLGGLRGAAQLLEIEYKDESVKEYTQIIISEADRLTTLVDNMLGSNQLPQKTSVNIHEVLEHARHIIEAKHPDTVSISQDYDPSIPEIRGDRDQLVQVILNLLNNAVRSFANTGHIQLRTRIIRNFTIRQDNYPLVLCAQVIDNGQGIPEELQGKIFFPMITGHAEGTGLGLSIAQSIINQHNGLIEFKSQPGKTEFSMIIPITAINSSNPSNNLTTNS